MQARALLGWHKALLVTLLPMGPWALPHMSWPAVKQDRIGLWCMGQASREDSRGCPDTLLPSSHRCVRGRQVLAQLLAAQARAAEAGWMQGLGALGKILFSQVSLKKTKPIQTLKGKYFLTLNSVISCS